MLNVLVTGTSSGIGLATALELGRAGHAVYATVRNTEKGATLRDIAAAEKLRISISTMDVDSDASVVEALADIVRQANAVAEECERSGASPRAGHVDR